MKAHNVDRLGDLEYEAGNNTYSRLLFVVQ